MKALSVRQPWAWAILHAGKDVENRSWRTKYRGWVLIHAARRIDRGALAQLRGDRPAITWPAERELVTGALLGRVLLTGCTEMHWSWWAEPGCWHWDLELPRPFAEPVPWRGSLGLFTVPDEAIPAVSDG